MAATAEFVQIMACKNFILRSVFEQLKSLVSALALKDVKVLDNKLVLLGPTDAQTLLLGGIHQRCARFAKGSQSADATRIQQVEDFFVVDLKERTKNSNVLRLTRLALAHALDLIEKLLNAALGDALEHLASEIFRHLSLVTFHGETLSAAGLTVCKNGSVVALDAAVYQPAYAEPLVNVVLTLLGRKHLVEGELLPSTEAISVVCLACTFVGMCSLCLHFNVLVVSDGNFRHLVSLGLLMRQHRPDSDADLNAGVGPFLPPLWAELVHTAREFAVGSV